jgi:hypothetical protein
MEITSVAIYLHATSRSASIRQTCPKCHFETKNLTRHSCSTKSVKEMADDAWEGYALHRLAVIKAARHHKISHKNNHILLAELLSNKHQATYVRKTKYMREEWAQYNDHKMGTIFEYYFLNSLDFKINYLSDLNDALQRQLLGNGSC